MLFAFGFYIWKQNKYIQQDLTKDLHVKFNRIENIVDKDLRGILIKLIDNAKKNELRMASIERSHKAVIAIMTALSGNGLKDKFK